MVREFIKILLGLLHKRMFLFIGDEYSLYYSFYFSIYFKHFIIEKVFWEWSGDREGMLSPGVGWDACIVFCYHNKGITVQDMRDEIIK